MSGYKWERQRRGKNFIPPLLSDHDEFVPETHIGIYSLLTNPKDPAIYMSDIQCQKIRRETFNVVNELYKKYGSPDFAVFWNHNLEAINDLQLNKFGTHTKLLPIIGIIECFEKKMRLHSNGSLRYIISFGINRQQLTNYLKEVRRSKKTGEKIPLPKLKLKGNKSKDFIIFGDAQLATDDGKKITVDRNAVYNQFSHWCQLNGITKKTGATMALKYFVENHPLDGLGELSDYDVLTEFDKTVFAKKSDDSANERVRVTLDGTVLSKARQIIRLYNRDIANISKPALSTDGYVNNAVHLLNQNMPLQYRDPDLYEQRRQLELMQAESGVKEADGFDFEDEDVDE